MEYVLAMIGAASCMSWIVSAAIHAGMKQSWAMSKAICAANKH